MNEWWSSSYPPHDFFNAIVEKYLNDSKAEVLHKLMNESYTR